MEQRLIIPENDVEEAVREYLKKKNIILRPHCPIHSKITYSKIGKSKSYHFGGYWIAGEDYENKVEANDL